MKKTLLAPALFVLASCAIVSAQETETQLLFKKWDYHPALDRIIFMADDDYNCGVNIKHEGLDDVEIKVDNSQKEILVRGSEKEDKLYKKIILLVPSQDDAAILKGRLAKLKQKRKDYLDSQNPDAVKTIEEFPLSCIDLQLPDAFIYFGVVEDYNNNQQGFMSRVSLITAATVALRDDGIDYTSLKIINLNTKSRWIANIVALILVPKEEDVIVWKNALLEWQKECTNWSHYYDHFSQKRLLPGDRITYPKETIKGREKHDYFYCGQKYELNRIMTSDVLCGTLEISAFWDPETFYVPVGGITVKELNPKDVPNEEPCVKELGMLVEFFDKDESYSGFHYKRAVIYAKPEILEKVRVQIEIYQKACKEYKERVK